VLLFRAMRGARLLADEPSDRFALAAAAGLLLTLTGTALLLAPSPPASWYQIRWEESPGGLEPYRGRVSEATLGSMELPRQRIVDSEGIRAALLRGEWLRVEGVAGPPPGELSHLFSLHEIANREVLLVAVDGNDLVLRYRSRAGALRLDQPSHRLAGALAGIAPGDAIRILARRDATGLCARVNDGETACGFGAGAARGWSFVLYSESFPLGFQRLLDFLWLLGLAMPAGFLLRTAAGTARVAGVLAAGLLLTGWLTSPLGSSAWMGVFAGLALGAAIRLLSDRVMANDAGEGVVHVSTLRP
jgi:hypothetical protein